MTKEVYVVSYGYYDWSKVRAVFYNEEAAKAYISTFPKKEALQLDITCVPLHP